MNNTDLLAKALEKEPHNDILAAMLQDELTDARDMLPTEAKRHVGRVIRSGCEREQLQRAAELLAGDGPERAAVLVAVSAELGFRDLTDHSLIVVAGDRGPSCSPSPRSRTSVVWGTSVVTVGAGWVLTQVRSSSR